LKWYTIETDHFLVLYHTGGEGGSGERSAREVARIAEEIYGPITDLYGYEPSQKVHIILKDFEDYSNGAAYFYDNKIEIWAPALDSPLRGDHAWLRNVVTHEFTHIVQVQAAMKMPRRLPFVYLQILDYENVRRPDVLYGYPNVVISYPIAGLSNPAWFAEGTAQYQRAFLDHDQWDTHRDMLLRTRVLSGNALSLAEMGGFYSKSSLVREGVYNHGYAFARYLATTYGESVLAELTRSLARWRNWNVERGLKEATGKSAETVYSDWMNGLEADYATSTESLRSALTQSRSVVEEGYANYHPSFSPDGARLAYVSSGDRHYGQTSLYIKDLALGTLTSFDIGPVVLAHPRAFGYQLRRNVGGPVTWRPDGEAIVYARRRTTSAGYLYSDLYEISIETRESQRLTRNVRASQPAYAPDGHAVAFVRQYDGSTNLAVWEKETETVRPLTSFSDGTQVTDPSWHGEWIYFALLPPEGHGRDLWRIRADGSEVEAVLATPFDERSPTMQGDVLYYSTDATGIFNVYRLRNGQEEQMTQVLGGAFMPDVREDGTIAYAEYQWDGYKIALTEASQPVTNPVQYHSPIQLAKSDYTVDGETSTSDEVPTDTSSARRYTAGFTTFSFFPVLRLDQYVSRRTGGLDRRLPERSRAGTIWRNTKFGFYTTSREMLESMSFFAGLLVGPGSQPSRSLGDALAPANLLSMERDVFLLFDYKRGLGFIPKRWSPQISLELFNIRRRVENGLTIEEFPCTACFPDSTLVDLTYGLWEGNIYLRSKVSRYLVLEAGYRYSPYRVSTDNFYSRELLQSIPQSASRYFIGRTILLNAYFEVFMPHREGDIFPIGVRADLSYEREAGKLLDRFDIRNGLLVPIYKQDINDHVRLDARWGTRIPGTAHGAVLRMRGTAILGKGRDNFYNDYVGGLSAARGYPFYALGGSKTFWIQTSYFLPIFPDIGRQMFFTYLDKAFLRLYADGAAVWPGGGALRKDLGAEVRLMLGSHYLLPTALFVSATYGLDDFDYVLDEGFVTPGGMQSVRYGREWQWHFGILFGFDL